MSEVCAMQASKRDFDNTTDDDADDALSPKSPEAFADRFGIRAAFERADTALPSRQKLLRSLRVRARPIGEAPA